MFLLQRPSPADIERFLDRSSQLPLSYSPIGMTRQRIARERLEGYAYDEQAVVIGRGDADFERACVALANWKHFDIGWVQLFPRDAPTANGTIVAVLIEHFGFWSLNGARVLYQVDAPERQGISGFAYGTLTNHAESGEELFEVSFDRQSGDVVYRIRALSRPQSAITWIGQPVVRRLQARFRHDSAVAMGVATCARS